jgi:hypothetical protein
MRAGRAPGPALTRLRVGTKKRELGGRFSPQREIPLQVHRRYWQICRRYRRRHVYHGGTDRHSSRGQIQGSVGTALSSRYGFRPSSLLRYRHRMDDEITTGARQLPTSPIAAARLVLSLPSKSGSLAMFAAILRASSSVSTFAH